jgi:hypothetical protein
MPTKYYKYIKGKKPQRRTVSFSLFVRKARLLSIEYPLDIAVHLGRTPIKEIAFLKDAEAKGLITNVIWIDSNPNNPEDRIKWALWYLHFPKKEDIDCKIVYGYDYAWIKIVLEHGPILDRYSSMRFMSTPKFENFIKSLGFKDVASSKTLNKYIAQAWWNRKCNRLLFPGNDIDSIECKRRNSIVAKFIEIMKEI